MWNISYPPFFFDDGGRPFVVCGFFFCHLPFASVRTACPTAGSSLARGASLSFLFFFFCSWVLRTPLSAVAQIETP
jgi:hypothetical protein